MWRRSILSPKKRAKASREAHLRPDQKEDLFNAPAELALQQGKDCLRRRVGLGEGGYAGLHQDLRLG
jgi:hypothetical protein